MSNRFRRRRFLHAAGLTAVAATLPLPGGVARAASTGRLPRPPRAEPIPLSAVRLLPSRFRANMDRTCAYLRFVDPDRLLHTFRLTVGLPSTAEPCGGWEAPDVQLRGHSTGHLLSGLAFAHANTGERVYADKARYLVDELATCQAAAPRAGYSAGYLSAFGEQVFDQLEAGGNPWAPYYTIHKIMAGLLDQYQLSGNQQALDVLRGMADWVDRRTGRLSTERMQALLRVEFGGMNEVLANLHLATGEPAYLRAAQRFDHEEIYGPLANGEDRLAGYHANTQIAKIVGTVPEYQATGEDRYRDIATHFWDTVVHHHSYVIGGNSSAEFFGPPDEITSRLSENDCENCNSYNMLKLTRLLYGHDPDNSGYFDYYEWTLYNQMLGEQDPDSAHGFCTYYTGMWPGSQREVKSGLGAAPGSYSSDYDNFSCDHGTGMETHVKFADSIYFHSGDSLYVNLFIASEVDWKERGVRLTQRTRYPEAETVRLTVTGSARFALKVRVPGWLAEHHAQARFRLNGRPLPGLGTPGRYATIDRHWRDGDTVEITLPMALTWRPAPDNPHTQAISYGPVVLGGALGDRDVRAIPVIDPNSVRPHRTAPLRFTATADGDQVDLLPFADIHHQRYTVYWTVPGPASRHRLVARYTLDEGTGTSAAEATGAFAPAQLTPGADWVSGHRGSAVRLDGATGHVALPPGLITGLAELTVSVWVRLDRVVVNSRVFDLGFHKQTYLFLTPSTGSGRARCAMKISGMSGEDVIDATGPLPTGEWTHVAVTIGHGTGVLYVNGVEAGRNTGLVMSPLVLGRTTRNYLGRSQNTTHPHLPGQLDDFRVYDYVLSATDVADLHRQAW